MITLIDATFKEKRNLQYFKYLEPKKLAQLPQLGYYAFNWFSSENYPFYLKEMNLTPKEFLFKFNSSKRKTNLISEVSTFQLVKNKKFSEKIVKKYINFLSQSKITHCKVFDPLNDVDKIQQVLNLIINNETSIKIIGGIFLRPELFDGVMDYSKISKLYDQYNIDQVSLIEPLGLLKQGKLKKILNNLNIEINKISLYLKSSLTKLPLLIKEALDCNINTFEIDNLCHLGNNYLSLPDTNLFNELDIKVKINFDLLQEFLNPIKKIKSPLKSRNVIPNYKNVRFISKGLDFSTLEKIKKLKENLNLKISEDEIYDECLKVKTEIGNPPLISNFKDLIITQTIFNIIDKTRYSTVPLKTKLYINNFWGQPIQSLKPSIKENLDNFIIKSSESDQLAVYIELDNLIDEDADSYFESTPETDFSDLRHILALKDTIYNLRKKFKPFSDIDFSNRSNLASLVKLIIDHDQNDESAATTKQYQNISSKSDNWRYYGRMMQLGRY